MKLAKKYYVAADRVTRDGADWCHETIEEAIEHARVILDREPYMNEKYIVKIIKVVKRTSTPIKVEDVK